METNTKEVITAKLTSDSDKSVSETIITDSITKTIFSAMLYIQYEISKNFYPDFSGFYIKSENPFIINDSKELEIMIYYETSDRSFSYKLTFIKGVDSALDTFNNVKYIINVYDNQIVLWMLSDVTKCTYCEAAFLTTPYSMVHTLESSDDELNLNISSMLNDYNRLMLPSVNTISICKEPDVYSETVGKELTYKKAMCLKNNYILDMHTKYTDLLSLQINKLVKEKIKHDRIKRHLAKSNKKLKSYIKTV